MRPSPDEIRLIRNDQIEQVAENSIVFDDDDMRSCSFDDLPDPIVVSVDINAEDADFPVEAGVANDLLDVIGCDERAFRDQIVLIRDRISLDCLDVVRAAVVDEPAPVAVGDQKSSYWTSQ